MNFSTTVVSRTRIFATSSFTDVGVEQAVGHQMVLNVTGPVPTVHGCNLGNPEIIPRLSRRKLITTKI